MERPICKTPPGDVDAQLEVQNAAAKTDHSALPPRKGTLLVVSGPSGVGKSTILEKVRESAGFFFSVSMTTRSRRTGEVDGVDYRFVSRAAFENAVSSGELLEWATYGGNLYGTPKGPVVEALECGEDVLFDIENDGAHQIRAAYGNAVLVFILPPSMDELERRLLRRGDTSSEDIQQRLAVAEAQIADAVQNYDHLVVNESITTAVQEMASILASTRD